MPRAKSATRAGGLLGAYTTISATTPAASILVTGDIVVVGSVEPGSHLFDRQVRVDRVRATSAKVSMLVVL